MKKIILYIVIAFSLLSCDSKKIEKVDILGLWEANDKSKITFLENGNCLLENVDYYILSPFKENENIKLKINKAKWSINNDNKSIHISYKLPDRKGNGGINFYFDNSKKKNFYIFIGDPDDNVKYEFIKQ